MNFSSKEYITFSIVAVLLLLAELAYFRIADKFNIIDKPNQRSSHSIPTIRGGGIIFLLAVVLFSVLNNWPYPYLIAGVTIAGIVSFLDDIKSLSSSVRFTSHIVAVICLFIQLTTEPLPVWVYIVGGIIAIGSINMYNFMDGINSITSFYSLSILVPLLLTEENSTLLQLEIYLLISILIFTWFNARKKARCFAGDIGSITLAILLLFLLGARIMNTDSITPLALLTVYVVDSGYTVIERLFKKENILTPHRTHLYQLLSNELKISHLKVSLTYALLQLFISILVLYAKIHLWSCIVLGIALLILYHAIKRKTYQLS